MGLFSLLRRDKDSTSTARDAIKEAREANSRRGRRRAQKEEKAARKAARRGEEPQTEEKSSALQSLVEMFRDKGLDGWLTFSSAQTVADRALKKHRKNPEKAVRRIIRSHRRSVTLGGFLTGLGGIVTLAVLLPVNIVEFYVQATRMVGAIAAVRGHQLSDEEIRTRVLAALVAEESDDVLATVGLGPVAGAATRHVAKRLPAADPSTAVARAIGGRVLARFGLRSVKLFGKAIPFLGAIIGAWTDRKALNKIAKAAMEDFPPVR